MKKRRHRGDIMSPEKRSALMSRIRGKNTGPERILAGRLAGLRLHWSSHDRSLPGTPDFVFARRRVVVFVDGDFWHGWRFPVWKDKLSLKWEQKIERTRQRDCAAYRKLKRNGWRVVRVWEHQIERDLDACVKRVLAALRQPKVRKHLPPSRKTSNLV
jgi:DNA mismatch endonuclease (patch repair protein)